MSCGHVNVSKDHIQSLAETNPLAVVGGVNVSV